MPGLTATDGESTGFAGAKTCHQLLFQLPGEVCRPQLLSTVNRVLGFALFCSLTPVTSQIRCYVHLTSYSFLQAPPLVSDTLVILIISPRGWGDPAFFDTAGFAGQTKKQPKLLFCLPK